MRTLVVYVKDSVFKYPNIFHDFSYELDGYDNILRIHKIVRTDQYDEWEHAVFNNWDYYFIEEDHEI